MISTTSCHNKQPITKAIYEGEAISGLASITRDKVTKSCYLHIATDGEWSIYAGEQVDSIDFSTPLLSGNKSGTYQLDVNTTVRYYFQLVTETGKAILAESHLPMTGGFNFRDLGGIRNQQGKHVKWGKFIRTDELKSLTEADLEYLSAIPVRSIVDFRSEMEIEQAPDILPASVQNNYQLFIDPGNILELQNLNIASSTSLDSVMITINEYLVSDPHFVGRYKRFFEILQDENQVPVIFHCTAGKDRTGMAAALILYALGVSEECIFQNYLESNIYLKEKYAGEIEKNPKLESVLTVKEEFLRAGINKIKEKYDSVEQFLTRELSVDINRFKDLYLD